LLLSVAAAWFLSGRALIPIQQAFQRQQEFVADASHELRTPLTVLRSATDVLNSHRDERLNDNGELFDDVRAEIIRMERLAQDLLTLARSDTGGLELMTAPLELADVAGEVVRRTTPHAQSAGIQLSLHADAQPATVEADPDRLLQVLLILIDNAIKHTPSGGKVEVRVRRARARLWRLPTLAQALRPSIYRVSSIGSTVPTRRGRGHRVAPVSASRSPKCWSRRMKDNCS
jgi:signal transduction histidine kinase